MPKTNWNDEIDKIIHEVLQEETKNRVKESDKCISQEMDGEEHFGFNPPCKNGGCD